MKKLILLLLLGCILSSCIRQAVVQLDDKHKNILVADPTNVLNPGDTVIVGNYSGGKWELVDLANLAKDTTYLQHGVVISYRMGIVKEIRTSNQASDH